MNTAVLIVLSAVIGLIVRLLKEDTPIPFTIPRWLRPWLSLLLGFLTSFANKIAHPESPWDQVTWNALILGLLPVIGHEFVIESLLGGKEVRVTVKKPTE